VSTFALVGGSYVAVTDYLTTSPPAAVVAAYFAALARDDAARALSYGPVPDGTHDYLTATVLSDQLAIGAIGDLRVRSVSEHAQTAQVSIDYQLRSGAASRRVSDVVPLVRHGRTWRLAESAVPTSVDLVQATRRAAVAGAAIPSGTVLMFPGALPLTFDTANLTLDAGGSTVDFGGGDPGGQVVVASAAGTSLARTAVADALADCLSGDSGSARCPLPVGGHVRAVPASLRGRLSATGTSSLKVQVTDDADGVLAISGMVDVDGSYQSLDFDNIASVVRSTTILVPVSARCYASAIKSSLMWEAPS
jgi:hypothetical protein